MKLLSVKCRWLIACVLWCGVIAFGYASLLRYSFGVGNASPAPRTIPSSLAGFGTAGRPQLFVALHPRCPCSRATVRELAKILTRAANATETTVFMYKPGKESDSWMDGVLLQECRRMNCQIRPDPNGQLAASLGSFTSGRVVLYDGHGKLRYHGGITGSRGHEGDNAGERAVIEILQGRRESQKSLPVFGCAIEEACN